jgi:AbrB family looped-hinge helix DNA binding protein
MTKNEAPNVIIVSDKGQIVIPQSIREKLGIKPRNKLLIYNYQDAIILKKLEIPDLTKELEEIYRKIDEKIAKYGELSDQDIDEIIQKFRKQKSSGS